MDKHLYNASVGKIRWFVKRFGWREMFLKPMRIAAAPIIIPLLPKRRVTFRGQPLELFYHAYNMTWAGERCVELPIARSYLRGHNSATILEVGNVLSHYFPAEHTIVDKYEKGLRVVNADIVEFECGSRYSLIVSISTFEHIGFDDTAQGNSGAKIQRAIQSCRQLLERDGLLVITVPIGYNDELDHLLASDALGTRAQHFVTRIGFTDWEEASKAVAMRSRYGSPYPYANSVAILEFGAVVN